MRCAWCGTQNEPAQASCVSCGTALGPPERSVEASAPSPEGSGWATSPTAPAAPAFPAAPSTYGGSLADPAASPQPGAGPRWPGPTAWTPTTATPAPAKRSSALWITLVVGLLAALGVFLYLKLQNPISYPGSIAGYQHDDSQIANAATDFLEKTLKGVGIQAKAAIYGDISNPSFMVIAFKTGGSPPPGTLDDFANGFGSTSGSTVATDQAVTETRDGVTYRCAPIVSGQPTSGVSPRAVCLWDDQSTGGFVISMLSSNPASAMDLTAQVHDAVVH